MMEFDGRPAEVGDLAPLALTNYGHFTSMLAEDFAVRGLSLHLERLVRDARLVFGAEIDPDRVRQLVRHALKDVAGPIVTRVTVYDPTLELGHPGADASPGILVTTRPAAATPLPPMRLQSAGYCRDMPEVKHVGLFGSLRYRRAAQLNGYDDALFTDPNSNVSEAATTNVGFFDGERIIWPKAEVLTGVTLALLAQVHDGPAVTSPVNLAQLGEMQAAFATNAVIGVRSIGAIDGTTWSADHPILDTLRREYLDVRPEPL
ncbi:MAG TPA: aminotransferase class IV family protein [Acidimicrobiales bacterium]|nr:aminotransferase class IV family protein [Acidimicrobiales bacterium]